MLGYDKISLNHGMLLDLPFREATGAITHDVAKPHHIAALTNAPTWDEIALSGLGVIEFNGTNQYLQIPAADSQDLDFTGDFTLAAWIYPVYTAQAMVIMCRNTTDGCGWCMFLYDNPELGTLLSFRTNQAGDHRECYAAGFPDSQWALAGYSRDSAGLLATCYENGEPLTTVPDPDGMMDPDPCGAANKLLIGVQEGEISNFYKGKMWRPRAWNKKLSASEWKELFAMERNFFGV